ncbi:hypothetical protein BC834DRAFT_966949 [Gloeopeniophorella convolvens]|nr:hypothetical protein BC834DRAFT_966949 [Gloeopeniophorella convolvens]
MSAIQLPEDQLIELLLQLKKTPPDQAKAILNSQPQIAYALVALMVKMGAIDIPIFQQTLATFTPQQGAAQPPPPAMAVPPHMQPQGSRGGTPQFSTPPPTAYPPTGPRAGPSGYAAYPGGPGGHIMPAGQYNPPPPAQPTNPGIPPALAAIPENQREIVLKLVNLRPDEIARLPPNERASVMQLRASLGIR